MDQYTKQKELSKNVWLVQDNSNNTLHVMKVIDSNNKEKIQERFEKIEHIQNLNIVKYEEWIPEETAIIMEYCEGIKLYII